MPSFSASNIQDADTLQTPVDLSRLQSKKFIALSEGFATWRGFQQAFRIAGFEPDIAVRVHDIFSLMSMVNAGVGYTLIHQRGFVAYPHPVQEPLNKSNPKISSRFQINLNYTHRA